MHGDDLAAFRAKHPSVAAAIQSCERPDWALQLAFEATENRKSVIRYGTNIIFALEGENDVIQLITPYPRALEAIKLYADHTGSVSRVTAHARALILGTSIAVPLAYVLDRYVWMDAHGSRGSVFRLLLLILIPLLTVLVRVSFAWMVRRRAERLDDESAFALVLGRVVRAADKHPLRVPKVMKLLRRNLVAVLEGL